MRPFAYFMFWRDAQHFSLYFFFRLERERLSSFAYDNDDCRSLQEFGKLGCPGWVYVCVCLGSESERIKSWRRRRGKRISATAATLTVSLACKIAKSPNCTRNAKRGEGKKKKKMINGCLHLIVRLLFLFSLSDLPMRFAYVRQPCLTLPNGVASPKGLSSGCSSWVASSIEV